MAEEQVVVVTAKNDRKVFTGGKGLCDTRVIKVYLGSWNGNNDREEHWYSLNIKL